MTSVGLSLFNYQDDARSNKHKFYIYIYMSLHLFFLISVWSFNPVGATAELIRWKYSEAPTACSLVACEVVVLNLCSSGVFRVTL